MIKRLSAGFFIFFVTVLAIFPASAQELMWDASFTTFFDNREYKYGRFAPSQTMFGARLAPELGLRWRQDNSLMVGVDLLADFGTENKFDGGNDFFVYYQYNTPKFKINAGVVPRRKVMGNYSGAFFNDSIKYYDPYIDGLLLQYTGSRGYVEFGADWNSKISDEKREKFLLFSASRLNFGIAYIGLHLSMYHHAGTFLDDGVVDNILVYPHAGVRLADLTGFDDFTIQAGWLNTFQNDRKYVGKYVSPGGFQVELNIEKWKFGISNTLYARENLMPYYVAPFEGLDYGPGLYWGEQFYRTSSVYDRFEAYWAPVKNDIMNLRVSTVHHYDGKRWNWQQRIVFALNLGQHRTFRNTY